jgi:hypothetical protein
LSRRGQGFFELPGHSLHGLYVEYSRTRSILPLLKWVQIECSGVNSSDTGYFREFSWEA